MANYAEARNGRKISKKSQTKQTDKSTTDVNHQEPDIVRSGAHSEPSATSRIGTGATVRADDRIARSLPHLAWISITALPVGDKRGGGFQACP